MLVMTYFLRSLDYKNIAIEYGKEVLSKLTFKGWTCSNARIHFPDVDYTFEKSNFWGTEYTIFRNGLPFGQVTVNWKGHILINLREEYKKPINLVLKYRGFWEGRMEVFLNEQPILNMHSKSDWTKAHYDIELLEEEAIIPYPMEELLGILAYGAYLFRRIQGQ